MRKIEFVHECKNGKFEINLGGWAAFDKNTLFLKETAKNPVGVPLFCCLKMEYGVVGEFC